MKNPHEHSAPEQFNVGKATPTEKAGSGNNPHERDSNPRTPVLKPSHNDPGPTPFNTSIKGV